MSILDWSGEILSIKRRARLFAAPPYFGDLPSFSPSEVGWVCVLPPRTSALDVFSVALPHWTVFVNPGGHGDVTDPRATSVRGGRVFLRRRRDWPTLIVRLEGVSGWEGLVVADRAAYEIAEALCARSGVTRRVEADPVTLVGWW